MICLTDTHQFIWRLDNAKQFAKQKYASYSASFRDANQKTAYQAVLTFTDKRFYLTVESIKSVFNGLIDLQASCGVFNGKLARMKYESQHNSQLTFALPKLSTVPDRMYVIVRMQFYKHGTNRDLVMTKETVLPNVIFSAKIPFSTKVDHYCKNAETITLPDFTLTLDVMKHATKNCVLVSLINTSDKYLLTNGVVTMVHRNSRKYVTEFSRVVDTTTVNVCDAELVKDKLTENGQVTFLLFVMVAAC